MWKKLTVLAAGVALLSGCDDVLGGSEGDRVAIRFATSSGASRSMGARASLSPAAEQLVVTGSNGMLTIEDIRLVVAEFELERDEDACEAAGGTDDECEEFEAPPRLLDLPLTGGAITVATDEVPAGTYTEMKFKVEDLDEDEDDERDRRAVQEIYDQLRSVYPNLPRETSMVVKGVFTPTGGAAQPFVVYFEAEIEVEKELVPGLTVPGDGGLTVEVDPAAWFRRGTQVVNLAALNGRRVEFELEIKNGFGKVKIDD